MLLNLPLFVSSWISSVISRIIPIFISTSILPSTISMIFVSAIIAISVICVVILLFLILFHNERILRFSSVTLTNFNDFILNLMRYLWLKHLLIQFLNNFTICRFYTFFGGMNHKCDKRKATTPSTTFISHDSNVDNLSSVFEIVLDILLFGRVQNSSNKELDINWISYRFWFLNRLLHRLSELKLLLLLRLCWYDLCLTECFSNGLNCSVSFICHILSQWSTVLKLLLQLS